MKVASGKQTDHLLSELRRWILSEASVIKDIMSGIDVLVIYQPSKNIFVRITPVETSTLPYRLRRSSNEVDTVSFLAKANDT